MTMKQIPVKTGLQACIESRDSTTEIWSIHLDVVTEWCPRNESYSEWMQQSGDLYALACSYADPLDVVVVALSFESSTEIELFQNLKRLTVDFFTPPSLYLLRKSLLFPSCGEEYYRLLPSNVLPVLGAQCVVVARSARSLQGLENGWEFDNTIYIASRFD